MRPRALILRTAGTNCDAETAHAFELAGASSDLLHVNRVLEGPAVLDRYQLLALPGGFSYGDDIAAGRIFANQLVHYLHDRLQQFVQQGKPVIGICNGFQVLVKTGMLPGPLGGRSGQNCTLAHNDSGRFVARWVRLVPRRSKCIWTAGLPALELPVAHGEGKFVPADDAVRRALWSEDQVALTYDTAGADALAGNPNGSVDDIAGICDQTGLILGLMPHPERFVSAVQHFSWTARQPTPEEGSGLGLFRNAVEFAIESTGIAA